MNRAFFIYPSHYRSEIYTLLNRELGIEFYFPRITTSIPKIDRRELPYQELNTLRLGRFSFTPSIIYKGYKSDILLLSGDLFNLSDWLLLIIRKIFEKKTIIWTHGILGGESILWTKIKQLFYSFPSDILVYSNHARDIMIGRGFHPNRISVIYNSLPGLKDLSQDVWTQYDVAKILFIGRLNEVKRFDILLESMRLLKSEKFDFQLSIVGEGPMYKTLVSKISAYDLEDKVILLGPLYEEEQLNTLFSSTHMLVSPGNIGLAAIHALTHGVPVISHDNFKEQMPESEAIQQGISGMFFRQNSASDLAVVICKLFNDIKNKNISRNGCRSVIDKHYNSENQLAIIRSLYE